MRNSVSNQTADGSDVLNWPQSVVANVSYRVCLDIILFGLPAGHFVHISSVSEIIRINLYTTVSRLTAGETRTVQRKICRFELIA